MEFVRSVQGGGPLSARVLGEKEARTYVHTRSLNNLTMWKVCVLGLLMQGRLFFLLLWGKKSQCGPRKEREKER